MNGNQMNNPLNLLFQMYSNGQSPEQILNYFASQNPQINAIINQQKMSGMSTKDMVLQLAKQQNVNINPLIQMMSRNTRR